MARDTRSPGALSSSLVGPAGPTGSAGPTGPAGAAGPTGPGASASAPATATSAGVAGTIAYDATHIYVCIATNSWVRASLAAW